ncbi:MAG: prolyl oligopeptidase family serine peptidase [Anaerolineales bacterium]|nr:prolyl oligopeptidase family serine peptidase [Anaerolineales bacterium]
MKNPKILRLGIYALVALVAALIAVNISLAWVYVSVLTQPGCSVPQYLDEMDPPEEHWLVTEDGHSLQAWYYPSVNGAAILALGGIGGSLGDVLPPVRPLIEAGYGVLQINSRACAQPPARVTLGADEVYDAAAGLEFLLSRPEVNPDGIGAFGFSMGGVTIIRTAAQHPEIKAVVAEGGFDQLGKHIVQSGADHSLPRQIFLYTVAGVFWIQTGVNPWAVSPIDDLPAISPRPVFLVYGEYEITRGGGRAQFDAAGEPKFLWVVPGGDHGSNYRAAPDEYERKVLEFFNQTILDR